MGKRIDLTGQRFGRLVVIGECGRDKYGKIQWLCKCECGNEKITGTSGLRGGKVTSCGCYKKEKMREKLKEQWNNEEFRQAQTNRAREQMKENWNDEEFRQMQSDILHYWKGGITPISIYLEKLPIVKQWFDDSKRQANYTCELTGKVGGVNTHHLKAFSTIVKEAHELHNIQVKPQVKDYTKEELHKLEEYVASWHKDNSNAVVLCKEVHDLFHRAKSKGGYGKRNNTPEQFEEFKQRYMAGEFKDLI